jgi:hypothetical protein
MLPSRACAGPPRSRAPDGFIERPDGYNEAGGPPSKSNTPYASQDDVYQNLGKSMIANAWQARRHSP